MFERSEKIPLKKASEMHASAMSEIPPPVFKYVISRIDTDGDD